MCISRKSLGLPLLSGHFLEQNLLCYKPRYKAFRWLEGRCTCKSIRPLPITGLGAASDAFRDPGLQPHCVSVRLGTWAGTSLPSWLRLLLLCPNLRALPWSPQGWNDTWVGHLDEFDGRWPWEGAIYHSSLPCPSCSTVTFPSGCSHDRRLLLKFCRSRFWHIVLRWSVDRYLNIFRYPNPSLLVLTCLAVYFTRGRLRSPCGLVITQVPRGHLKLGRR